MNETIDHPDSIALLVISGASDEAPKETTAASKATPDGASVGRTVPERLQVLTAKANFWANALSIEHDRLHDRQRRLGYPVVLITALTGVAAFTQLEGNPSWWATLVVSVFAFVAAGLAAFQTQADFAARANAASDWSEKFGGLYGTMLDTVDGIRRGETVTTDTLDKLYAEYEAMKHERPSVSQRVRAEARLTVARDIDAMKR